MREDAFHDLVLDLLAEVSARTPESHADLQTLGDLHAWGCRVRLEPTPAAVWLRLERELLARGTPRALVRPDVDVEQLLG
jgi:hypothetical protein